jgi:hypothetical protein
MESMKRYLKIGVAVLLSTGWVFPLALLTLMHDGLVWRKLSELEAAVKGQPPPLNSFPLPPPGVIENYWVFSFTWLGLVVLVWSFIASRRIFKE